MYKTAQPVYYVYDYFEKDHLGNIRVVLGTETEMSVYAATMETAAAEKENALFNNIDNTRAALPAGYPADATTNPNQYVAKLDANTGCPFLSEYEHPYIKWVSSGKSSMDGKGKAE